MPYIGTSPSNGVRRVHTYTATASQTTFTGASSEGVTLSYVDTNYIDVFQNGVLLGSADYTSTSGTSVVLAQGASADDLIVIVVYDVFSVADTVSKTNGGTFDGGVTVSGAFTSQGIDDNADATAITITSSEDVGIGTTTPTGTGWSSGAKTLQISQDSTSGALLRVTSSNTDGVVGAFNNAMQIATIGDDPIQFYTNSSERIKIDSSGNVQVNQSSTSSPGFGNTTNGLCFSDSGRVFSSASGAGSSFNRNSDNGVVISLRRQGNQVGNVTVTTTGTSFNTSSDYRLKDNIKYDFDATTRLKKLKPCRFNFKTDADTTVDGFLAHEVSSIVPEAISGEKDAVDADGNIDPQGIDQSKLVPLLVKTIQELEARITALESK